MHGDDELEAAQALARVRKTMFGRGPGGLRIGRYLLQEALGAGGEGTVYAAYDPELGRRVAVKLLRDPSVHTRTLHEARALARLHHPNVVTVHDAGEYDLERAGMGSGVFIVLELVEGDTLDGWLGRESRSLSEILDVMLQVGRGLAAVHAAGLVHRDVKPRNILVGQDGRVLLTDFGVSAPDAGDSLAQMRSFTSGTPRYMPPEQREGGPPNTLADQWSFCATLWTATVGGPPPTKGLSAASAAMTRAHLPAHVRRVLVRGLRVDPAERFPSMAVLLAQLDKPRRQRRRLALAAGLGMALGSAAILIQGPDCEDADALVEEAWTSARAEALAQALGPEDTRTVGGLERWADAWTEARRQACEASRARDEEQRRRASAQIACLDRELFKTAVLVDVLLDTTSIIRANAPEAVEHGLTPWQCIDEPPRLGEPSPIADRHLAARMLEARLLFRFEGADAALVAVEDIDPEILSPGLAGQWHAIQAMVAKRRGEVGKAEAEYLTALRLVEASGAEEMAVRILIDLAHCVSSDGSRLHDAQRLIEQAQARAESAHLGNDMLAMVALTRANNAVEQGQADVAMEALDDLDRVCAQDCGPARDLLAAGKLARGNLHLDRGELGRADAVFREHLALVRDGTGLIRRQAWMSTYNLALVATDAGDLEGAEAWLDATKEASPPDNWRIPYAHASIDALRGDPDAMERHLDQAEAELERSVGRSNWILSIEVSRASTHALRGSPGASVEALEAAHAAHVREFGQTHHRTVEALEALGEHEALAGDLEGAEQHLRAVFAEREQRLGPGHPLIARSHHELAKIRLALGDPGQARSHLEAARPVWESAVGPFTQRQLEMDHDLARALLLEGEVDIARDVLEDALARAPEVQGGGLLETRLRSVLAEAAALGGS